MSDMIGELMAANAAYVKPADSVPIVTEDGGAYVAPQGQKITRDDAEPATAEAPAQADAAALLAGLVKALKPPEAPIQLGERIPVESRDGSRPAQPVADKPAEQAAPVPAQAAEAAPTAPVPVTPAPEVGALAQQLADAQRRLAEAQASIDWRAANEPILEAVRAKWPYIQGLEQQVAERDSKLAEATAKAEFEELKARHIQESLEAGLKPQVDILKREWERDRLLARAAEADKRVDARLSAIFQERDQVYQQQQQEQRQREHVAQAQQHFLAAWNSIEQEYPFLKGKETVKRLAWTDWTSNTAKPVKDVVQPYINDLRAQAVAAQAPQVTRAEANARMPVTVSGGSGAAAAPTPQRPKNWARMGLAERLPYLTGRR